VDSPENTRKREGGSKLSNADKVLEKLAQPGYIEKLHDKVVNRKNQRKEA